jgi:hypothetical protein
MKKAVWVLNIDNYRPDITKHTLPNIRAYADKIGADFHIITDRKFPAYPVFYEKLQVWDLGQEYDWNILIDADLLISNQMPDLTQIASKEPDTVLSYQQFNIANYFKPNDVFKKLPVSQKTDGTGVAIVSPSANLVVTSKATHILYKPLSLTPEEIRLNITNPNMVDEYAMATNLAENNLKTKTLLHMGIPNRLVFHAAHTSDGPRDIDWAEQAEAINKPVSKLVLVAASESIKQLTDVTHPAIKAYAKRIGADFHVIQNATYENPEDWKFLIPEYLKDYDRVLYVDSDLIIRDDAPDIFEIVPENKLGVLYESRFIPKTEELNSVLDALSIPKADRLNKFYGTGVIVASKHHAPLFTDRLIGKVRAEIAFNVALHIDKFDIHEIHYKFNYQAAMDKITGEERHSAYFIHYSGMIKRVGPEALSKIVKDDLDIWTKDSPNYQYKKNIGIIVEGGLGDQIAAEPTVRYIVEHLYKGENVVIRCNWPDLFTHIGVPVFVAGDKNIPAKGWHELYTLRSPDFPIWSHVSHTLTNATDYASISAIRMQLPLEHRQIRLPHNQDAKEKVTSILNEANGKKVVAVHCGKGWKTKTFPSHIWQSYINILNQNGFAVVLIGKTINEGQGFVEVDSTGCIDLRDKLDLKELIELIRQCDLLLTNDSSPIHIAGDSDCWIGVIATCKHPDYIWPYRNGDIRYKTRALEAQPMYFDYDRRPSSIDGSTIDKCTDERLLECLPTPEAILNLAKQAS